MYLLLSRQVGSDDASMILESPSDFSRGLYTVHAGDTLCIDLRIMFR